MFIEGRRKKNGPGRTCAALLLYIILMRDEAVLLSDLEKILPVTERTLFRYLNDLRRLLPEEHLCLTDRDGRKTIYSDTLSFWDHSLYPPAASSCPKDAQLTHLARLIELWRLLEKKIPYFYRMWMEDSYEDEEEEEDFPSASQIMIWAKEAGLPPVSRRTMQRDIKEIRLAMNLYAEIGYM